MKALPAETDFVIIGTGIAGLRAAIELSAAGRVLILTKKELANFSPTDAKSEAAWLSDEDELILHLQDTLTAGDGLCNVQAVHTLLEEAPERIDELIAWGKHHGTKLVFGLESTSSRSRSLHAQGDATGREILRVLYEKLKTLKHVSMAQFTFPTELLMDAGRIAGVSVFDEKGTPKQIACSAVLLASGGLGQVYRNTTNPDSATGDGIALALRAGAEASDMEFIQFHPTALYMKKAPRFALPEILRMEGAYLRNIELNRFMAKYHPMAERAPQDVVVRAIVHEMEVSRAKDPFGYLDLTHISAAKIQKLFPRVYATCMAHNLDITEDLIPVRPGANSCIGGVRTDLDGRTTVPGLYAAGEVAATGLHGANRLASNSVLEGLVYGARAGKSMRECAKSTHKTSPHPEATYSNGPIDAGIEDLIGKIQDVMWNDVGIVRGRTGMQRAIKTLEEMAPRLDHPKTGRAHEASHMRLTALLIARSALAREESRGVHYRIDYPDHDDKKFLKHSVVKADKIVFLP